MRKQASMVDSEEEDEDGNLLERSSSSEESMGKSDEDYEDRNISETNSKSSLVRGSDNSTIESDEHLSEDEDSSSFQPENQDDTKSFNGSSQKTQAQIDNGKPTLIKKSKPKNLKTTTKVTKPVSKKNTKNLSFEENSDDSSASTTAKSDSDPRNSKFAVQPTPQCDAIMEKVVVSNQNSENPYENRLLRRSKSTNNSKNLKSLHPNQSGMGEINDISKGIQAINKVDPNITLDTEQSETDITICDPLLVKKEETDIKLEIKEEYDSCDEYKEDIKQNSIEEESTNLIDFDDCREDDNVSDDTELGQCSIQIKRKGTKRKNEDDPSYPPKTKKQYTPSHTKNSNNQQGKTSIPNKTISRNENKESEVTTTRRQGRLSKYSLVERNEEFENNHSSEAQGTNEKDTKVSAPKVLSGMGNTQRKIVNSTSFDLQPIISLIPCDLIYPQLTEPKKKRGRPPKAKNAGSPKNIQNRVKETTVSNVSTLLSAGSRRNSPRTKLKPNEEIYLELSENDSADSPLSNLLKTEESVIPTINRDDVFDDKDLLFLQQVDNPMVSSSTVQMTAKETNSFIADYLISHQKVFDDIFFQNILPGLSEFLMLCMDEFSELLVRNKKARMFTSKELRQQEVKLAIQSFCEKISSYSDGFFPSFHSVMYKIDQNKTKKALMIAFVFFLANSLWIKTPKFKGQIHIIRKMLICMCQIKKINSPLSLAVLTTQENMFNDELRLLLKILLVLQKKNVLAIPTTALSEISSNDSIEEVCESIISLSTSCSSVSDLKHSDIATQIMEIFKEEKQHNSQGIHEDFNHVLCMLKPNNYESKSETPEESGFESGLSHSLTQPDRGLVFAENLEQTQVGGLDSLFKSYYKSTSIINEDVKSELDAVLSHNYNTQSTDLTFPMPIDNAIKVEEEDCSSLVEFTENIITKTPSDLDNFIPENDEQDPECCEQDPLSF